MSSKKSRQDENAVLYGVREVCALYRVDVFRMQSRTLTVPGAAGRMRPLFVGAWTDANGQPHYKGMADLLARPRIRLSSLTPRGAEGAIESFEKYLAVINQSFRVTIPLWIECKSGGNRLSADQEAFRHHVTANGEYWISVCDDLKPLMDWFAEHGIREGGR